MTRNTIENGKTKGSSYHLITNRCTLPCISPKQQLKHPLYAISSSVTSVSSRLTLNFWPMIHKNNDISMEKSPPSLHHLYHYCF